MGATIQISSVTGELDKIIKRLEIALEYNDRIDGKAVLGNIITIRNKLYCEAYPSNVRKEQLSTRRKKDVH